MPTRRALGAVLILVLSTVACGHELPGVQASPSPVHSVTQAPSQAPTSPSSRPATSDGPLVTIETRGGECPAGACGGIVAIDVDGRVHTLEPAAGEIGTVPAPTIEALAIEIDQTDFAAIKSHPFTGECPVAFDGQETIYTFTTATGPERIASCEIEVDPEAPLFAAVQTALAAAGAR